MMCAELLVMRIIAMWVHVVILMEYLIEYLVCSEVRLMYVEWWTMMVMSIVTVVAVVLVVTVVLAASVL